MRLRTSPTLVIAVLPALGVGCLGPTPSVPTANDDPHRSICDAPIIDPVACDFGDVVVGGVGGCTVTVGNECDRGPMTLDAVSVDGDPAFRLVPTGLPVEVASREVTTVLVHFVPGAAGAAAGALHVSTSFGPADVALSGAGADALTCEVRVASVNGVVVGVGQVPPAIDALDDVELAVDASRDTASVAWSVAAHPPGAAVTLTSPTSASTHFVPETTGAYRVCADVADAGALSAQCCADVDAVARTGALVARLSSSAGGEGAAPAHLHLIKANGEGAFCVDSAASAPAGALSSSSCAGAPLDCHAGTCRGDDAAVEWDGVPGRTAGDPVLHDDASAPGEDVEDGALAAGRYLVVLDRDASGAAPATDATVTLFLAGQLASELSVSVDDAAYGELAVVVARDDGALCLEDLTDGDPGDDCP